MELNQRRELGGQLSRMDRAKLFMEKIVEKVGFFGILAFASVSKIILRKPRKQIGKFGINYGGFVVW